MSLNTRSPTPLPSSPSLLLRYMSEKAAARQAAAERKLLKAAAASKPKQSNPTNLKLNSNPAKKAKIKASSSPARVVVQGSMVAMVNQLVQR